jgi:hypothetical protein
VKVVPAEKRLYVVEPELSRVLANVRREGNVLSQVIREAYDSGDLATLTVTPRRATGAHVAVVGHITPDELRARLDSLDLVNGFSSRFLWFSVRSDKVMARTRPVPDPVFAPLVKRLQALEKLGRRAGERAVEMDAAAASRWEGVYPGLREDRPGLAGAVVSRGPAMVLRLALIYALLDTADPKRLAIRVKHLEAALAVWDYCTASALALFGGIAVGGTGTRAPAIAEAKEWLQEALKDGPVLAADLLAMARASGLCEKTLRKAAKELGIDPLKTGGAGKPWSWALPT